MKFKLDENLSEELALYLEKEGHDAKTVLQEGLQGEPDKKVIKESRVEQRIFVTLDQGFANILSYPPREYPGIIVLSPITQDKNSVHSVFESVLEHLGTVPIHNRLWVVDETSLRIRPGSKEQSND